MKNAKLRKYLLRCSVSGRSTSFFNETSNASLKKKTRKWQLSSSKISGRDNKKYVCNTIIFLKKAQNWHSQELRMFFKTPVFFYAAIKEKNKKKKISKPQRTLTSCWSHLSNEMLRIAISYWEGCMFFLSQGKFWNCFDVFSVKQFFITLML